LNAPTSPIPKPLCASAADDNYSTLLNEMEELKTKFLIIRPAI